MVKLGKKNYTSTVHWDKNAKAALHHADYLDATSISLEIPSNRISLRCSVSTPVRVQSHRVCVKNAEEVSSQITWLFLRVDVPNHIVWQANYFVSCSFGHFGKPFCLCLILESVAGKIDAWNGKYI